MYCPKCNKGTWFTKVCSFGGDGPSEFMKCEICNGLSDVGEIQANKKPAPTPPIPVEPERKKGFIKKR